MSIPTLEEYKKAKNITDKYENEQERLYKLRVDAFTKDLSEYFQNNLIDGIYRIKEFTLRKEMFDVDSIIPTEPPLEECYEGGNNEDIEALCKKHNVKFKFVYWMYHK